MSLYNKFATCETTERDGAWCDLGEEKVLVARAGGANVKYLTKVESMYERYRRQFDLKIMDEELARREMVAIYADTIILDWEGVRGRDGELLEFTRENVVQVLTDLPEFFLTIKGYATELAVYKARQLDDAAGN